MMELKRSMEIVGEGKRDRQRDRAAERQRGRERGGAGRERE